MKRRLLSILLALCMLLSVIPMFSITASALEENVKYIDAYGMEKTCDFASVIDSITTDWGEDNGWYIVTEDVEIEYCVSVDGNVNLILADGCTLTVDDGINVCNSASLTIYSQSHGNNTGKLIANGANYQPGIGYGEPGGCGSITINGGIVTATGGDISSGIGGEFDYSTSSITINGGTVTATGGAGCAGIGGNSSCSAYNISIKGGSVTAAGGADASGIGGGVNSNPSDNITVDESLVVKVGDSADSLKEIENVNTMTDSLAGKRYVTIAPPTYAITSATCTNGSVSTDKATAASGETVTVTPTANSGYGILSVYYQPEGESLIPIAPVSGVYSFTMPDKAVLVVATFKLSKNKVSEDITISFKTGYTPTAGDTLATLLSNVEYSNTTLLDYNIMVADSDFEELSSTDTLKAGESYYFVPMYITLKDSTNYEFSGQANTAYYNGNVTVLGDIYTYLCGVLSGDDFEAVKDTESANALGFYFLNTAFPTFTVPVPTPEPVKNAEYYASLTLNENIDVNFSMENLGSEFDLEKLSVTVDGAEPQKAMKLDKSGNVVGVLKAVKPHEMGKPLHIVITYDGVTVKDFNYSILNYCNAVYNAQGYGKNSKLGRLCTALINYGKWAEDYYNEANKISADASTVNAAEVIDFSGNTVFGSYTAPKDEFKASDTVTYAGGSLTLGSTITLNFYVFTAEELSVDNISILNNLGEMVNPENITVEAINNATYGDGYIIKINNIGASKLSRVYTLTIDGVAESVFKVVYGVESYCYNVQSSDYTEQSGYTATLKTLCKAIYNYAEAAKAYDTK